MDITPTRGHYKKCRDNTTQSFFKESNRKVQEVGFTDDLALLSEQLQDDLEIVDSSQAYQDALPPAPPAEGNYKAKIDFLGAAKDANGNPKFQTNDKLDKFPTLVYNAVVVEPVELEGKRLSSFERVYTRPFLRQGAMANSLMDLTRSFDSTRGWRTVSEGIAVLKELAETASFRCRIIWEAYDTDYAKHLKEAEAVNGTLTNEQLNSINKRATIRGMKKFDPNPQGGYLSTVKHPISGNVLTARAKITQLFPSHQEGVKI